MNFYVELPSAGLVSIQKSVMLEYVNNQVNCSRLLIYMVNVHNYVYFVDSLL